MAAVGAYGFAFLQRFILDLQGVPMILGIENPLFVNANYLFFLKMTPYLLTILALIWGSRQATRKHTGSPAALGVPYIRGERGL